VNWQIIKSTIAPPAIFLSAIGIVLMYLDFPRGYFVTSTVFIIALSVICAISQLMKKIEFCSGLEVASFSLIWYFLAFGLSSSISAAIYPRWDRQALIYALRLEFMASWYFWIIFSLLLPCWAFSALLLNGKRR
jgi:hypothetical protein